MTTKSTLSSHPRLYISPEHIARLRQDCRHPTLQKAQETVALQAEEFAPSTVYPWDQTRHNAHLIRARHMQTRILTLLVEWLRSGRQRYRDAAVAHVAQIGKWQYWSWITWRKRDPRPEATFDLSYGENSATLAIAYDLLFDTLSDSERALFHRIALERSLKPFLHHTQYKEHAWWFKHPQSNWNSVCAGGGGMLALALADELPEARQALPYAETSIEPFMRELEKTRGGWPEGIGYWNYGMRYAFMYLLSHERATGHPHPLLQHSAVKATLEFPLDFCPNGVPCSFGDVNHWQPLPFHYAAAERLGLHRLVPVLDSFLEKTSFSGGSWPNAAELLLLHPRRSPKRPVPQKNVLKVYRGLDWVLLADQMPSPNLYLAIRGGTTEVPHGHRDLTSFHFVTGKVSVITNIGVDEYLDTTFSPRRWELFETMPASKNVLLINGVGITGNSQVSLHAIRWRGFPGVRIDSTAAMGQMRDGSAAKFCGRLFLLMPRYGVLIVDRVELHHFGRVESRMHTYSEVSATKQSARLQGTSHKTFVAYASSVPATLHTATTAPTTPGKPATALRWCTDALIDNVTMAAFLSPDAKAETNIVVRKNHFMVELVSGTRRTRLAISNRLRLV